jgi:hypothetical protein
MPTIIDDTYKGAPIPGFVRPTMRESLAKGFTSEAEFFEVDGLPFVVWPEWDYAENWSTDTITESHPFHPILHGRKISETEFRQMLRTRHGIEA